MIQQQSSGSKEGERERSEPISHCQPRSRLRVPRAAPDLSLVCVAEDCKQRQVTKTSSYPQIARIPTLRASGPSLRRRPAPKSASLTHPPHERTHLQVTPSFAKMACSVEQSIFVPCVSLTPLSPRMTWCGSQREGQSEEAATHIPVETSLVEPEAHVARLESHRAVEELRKSVSEQLESEAVEGARRCPAQKQPRQFRARSKGRWAHGEVDQSSRHLVPATSFVRNVLRSSAPETHQGTPRMSILRISPPGSAQSPLNLSSSRSAST